MVDITQSGANSTGTKFNPFGIGPGVSIGGKSDAGNSVISYNPAMGGISPVMIVVGILATIFLLKLVGESPKTSIDGADIHVGGYNVLVILLITFAGTALTKLLFNTVRVVGVTDLVNFL